MHDPEGHPLFRIVLAAIVLLALVVLPAIDDEVESKIRALENPPRTQLTKGAP